MMTKGGGCGGGKGGRRKSTAEEEEEEEQNQQQLSLVEFLLTALRKSVVSCRVDNRQDDGGVGGGISSAVHHMEIGWPTNVRHITHVTFDRFHGFLGLPHELQVEIPCRVPSARYQIKDLSQFLCCFKI